MTATETEASRDGSHDAGLALRLPFPDEGALARKAVNVAAGPPLRSCGGRPRGTVELTAVPAGCGGASEGGEAEAERGGEHCGERGCPMAVVVVGGG